MFHLPPLLRAFRTATPRPTRMGETGSIALGNISCCKFSSLDKRSSQPRPRARRLVYARRSFHAPTKRHTKGRVLSNDNQRGSCSPHCKKKYYLLGHRVQRRHISTKVAYPYAEGLRADPPHWIDHGQWPKTPPVSGFFLLGILIPIAF